MKFVEEITPDTGMGTSKAKQLLIKILKMKNYLKNELSIPGRYV